MIGRLPQVSGRGASVTQTENDFHRRKHMEIVLLIGMAETLGGLALGLGMFVLDKPPA